MEQEKNVGGIFWLVVVFIILLAGVASFYFKGFSFTKSSEEELRKKSEEISNIPSFTKEQERLSLENKAAFLKRDIKSSVDASTSDVDRELSVFLLADSNNTLVKKEVYVDNSNGFNISYEVNKKIYDAYSSLSAVSRTSPYNLTFGSRTDRLAVLTSESDGAYIKVFFESTGDNTTKISVDVILK